ncbi:MAG TPA: SpoIIE family protein phosphatase [Firmicutes bacterium]|nr:SpoIIE family protein phosphatase [Bacillota bacterium]
MEIRVAVAKVGKYAAGISGDSVEVVERPRGGVSVIIVDGQGSGRAAKRTSHMIAGKAASLIEDGARDGAVMRVINDHLYAFRDGQVSATATILTADLDHDCFVVSRNSNTPVIMGSRDDAHCLDAQVDPIGVRRLIKPAITQFKMRKGLVLMGFTDGVIHAGRYGGRHLFSRAWVYEQLKTAASVRQLVDETLDYALELEGGKPKDDMVVAALTVVNSSNELGIRRLSVSYPF